MAHSEDSRIEVAHTSEEIVDTAPETVVRAAVMRSQTANPALQRLKGRLLAEAEASEVITSYDRMHHRHNRS